MCSSQISENGIKRKEQKETIVVTCNEIWLLLSKVKRERSEKLLKVAFNVEFFYNFGGLFDKRTRQARLLFHDLTCCLIND